MSIGFIGLGNLGTAIAQRLERQGEDVKVWNRTAEKGKNLGFEMKESPKSLIEACDTVFMCLFDSSGVRDVLCKENGLLSADLKDKTIIDLTTNHFDEVVEFHKMVAEKNGSYLEAPVFGSVIPATKGEITIVTAGREELFIACNSIRQF